MSQEPSSHFKYWAFISYSHRDKKWGDWLHKELETYKVPKNLIGNPTSRGEDVPKRLFPVFRDREELPTSSDLGSQITRALEKSRYLIVICSPNAAKSRWVNEEILAFKRSGRQERILALIVAGEPNASNMPGRENEECFPEALRFKLGPDGELTSTPAEPIAADLRRQGDGKSSAFLKLAAGLLGVGFDDLRQRDAERKVRRLRAMLALVTTLSAVFVALGVALFFQRQEAKRNEQMAKDTLGQGAYVLALERIEEEQWSGALAHLAQGIRHAEHRNCGVTAAHLLQRKSWARPMAPPVRIEPGGIDHVKVVAGGTRIVAASEFGVIGVFEATTSLSQLDQPIDLRTIWREELGTDQDAYPGAEDMRIFEMDVSADGKVLAVVDGYYGDGDIRAGKNLRTFDLETGRQLGRNEDRPGSVAISPDGKMVAVHNHGWEDPEKWFEVMNATDLSPVSSLDTGMGSLQFEWIDEQRLFSLTSGPDSTQFRVTQSSNGNVPFSTGGPPDAYHFILKPDRDEFIFWTDNTVYRAVFGNPANPDPIWNWLESDQDFISNVQYGKDLPYPLVSINSQTVYVGDPNESGGLFQRHSMVPGQESLAVVNGENRVFGVNHDGAGQLLGLVFDQVPPVPMPAIQLDRQMTLPAHCDPSPIANDHINALAVSPDGGLLAAGSGDEESGGALFLWDNRSGKFLARLNENGEPYGQAIYQVEFLPGSKILLARYMDFGVLYDLEIERPIDFRFPIVDASESRVIAPEGIPPVWFADLLEAVGGLHLPESGIPVPVEDRFAKLDNVVRRLDSIGGEPQDPWARLAYEFLGPIE